MYVYIFIIGIYTLCWAVGRTPPSIWRVRLDVSFLSATYTIFFLILKLLKKHPIYICSCVVQHFCACGLTYPTYIFNNTSNANVHTQKELYLIKRFTFPTSTGAWGSYRCITLHHAFLNKLQWCD